MTGDLAIGGTVINSTAANLNTLSNVTAGTASANKAIVLSGTSDITGINELTTVKANIKELFFEDATVATVNDLNQIKSYIAGYGANNSLSILLGSTDEGVHWRGPVGRHIGIVIAANDDNDSFFIASSDKITRQATGIPLRVFNTNELWFGGNTSQYMTEFGTKVNINQIPLRVTPIGNDIVIGSNSFLSVTNGKLRLSGVAVTSTAAELNKMTGMTSSTLELSALTGLTATSVELNKIAGLSEGVAMASKTIILNSLKNISGIGNVGCNKLDIDSSGSPSKITMTSSYGTAPTNVYAGSILSEIVTVGNDNNIARISAIQRVTAIVDFPNTGSPVTNRGEVHWDLLLQTDNSFDGLATPAMRFSSTLIPKATINYPLEAASGLMIPSTKSFNHSGISRYNSLAPITAPSYALSVDSDYTFIVFDTTASGGSTFVLGDPAANVLYQNRRIYVKRIGTGDIILQPGGAYLIDGAVDFTMTVDKQACLVASNATAWYILASYL